MSERRTKIDWEGEVLSVKPRIRLLRSFDERPHSYLGYVLRIRGTPVGEARDLAVAVGKGAHEKHQLRAGDRVPGKGEPVRDARAETADPLASTATPRWAPGSRTREDVTWAIDPEGTWFDSP